MSQPDVFFLNLITIISWSSSRFVMGLCNYFHRLQSPSDVSPGTKGLSYVHLPPTSLLQRDAGPWQWQRWFQRLQAEQSWTTEASTAGSQSWCNYADMCTRLWVCVWVVSLVQIPHFCIGSLLTLISSLYDFFFFPAKSLHSEFFHFCPFCTFFMILFFFTYIYHVAVLQ